MKIIPMVLRVLWASPWTALGLLLGSVGSLSGGGVARLDRGVGFWGKGVTWLLRHLPIVSGAAAVTFGHVVLAGTRQDLRACWGHECVHVRQYERWGPFMVPAYLLCYASLWLAGKDPYMENPFEKEARGARGRGKP